MKFTIPIRAVPKGRPKARRIGKFISVYTPAKTRNFEKDIARRVKRHIKTPTDSLLSVELEFFFTPAPSESQKKKLALYGAYYEKHKDCDNLAKSVLDGMNKIAYNDDSQIVELFVSKKYAETDYIVVSIEEIKDSP